MTIVKVNGQDWQTGIPSGCSSPNGHYVGCNVVLTAIDAGWRDRDAEDAALSYADRYWRDDWDYADTWQDIVDEAESYLNNVTEGGIWIWTDGDFRLVAVAECEECGEMFDRDEPGECPDHFMWGDF